MCGGKRETAPLHSLGKFQLCLDVPLALALCFASLDFCRNVIPQQTGLVCHCYLHAWRCMCLGMSTSCKFQVLIKKLHQSLSKISSYIILFSSCLIFLFYGDFLLCVQKLKVGTILFIFFLNILSATTEVFWEFWLFPRILA